MSDQKTAKGTPIAHMWACPMPDPMTPGAGYPVLSNAKHVRLYRATRKTGGYNHHSRITVHAGRFYAMWSNHPHGEDGPGQRVLFARSDDGTTWTPWSELFPPPGPVRAWEDNGLVFSAGGWAVHDGRLFARAGCYADVGFESSDRTSFSPTRDRKHKFRKRERYCAFAREVRADGSLGAVLPLGRKRPPNDDMTCPYKTAPDQLTRALQRRFRGRRRPTAADTNRLCEPTHYRARDGKHVCLLRDDTYSHRLYVSVTDDARTWPPAMPTDIPDSPSLCTTVTLDDGTVLLIGNQMAPKFDNPRERTHYQRDPLTVAMSSDGYLFTRVHALRTGQQEFRVPGVGGRGGGGQYPSALVHEGTLYVQYSMGKEDIWVTSVPLADLQLEGASVIASEEATALYEQALRLEADLKLTEAVARYRTLLKCSRRAEAWQTRKDAQQGLRRIEKFRAAFGMSEEALHRQLAGTFRGYRRSERAEWEKRGWIDARHPDGRKEYSTLNTFNLAYHDVALRRRNKRLAEPDRRFAELFLDLAEELEHRRSVAKTPVRYVNPRTFVYSVKAEIDQADLPRGKTVRAWFPFPLPCPATQDVQILSVRPKGSLAGPPDVEAETGIAYLEMPRPQQGKLIAELRVSFAAYETDFSGDPANVQPYDEQGELYQRYTKSEQHIRLTSQTRKLAKSIVGAETNPCLKARTLYDWVCDNVRYNGIWTWRESLFSPYGCASEDVRKRRVGDCLTQSEFYAALCRSVGLPARVCGGPFFLPGFKNDHAWAEVYFAGHGWMPVDVTASEGACLAPGLAAAQTQTLRDFFFGHLDCYRVRTYRSQAAQPLVPPKRSPRRRTAFFTYPEFECGGNDVEKYKLHWDCQAEDP